ncbi:hypothetical protein LV457_00385 [Mycobacterium sp. MYCO198283]|nr:glycine betaine ABC transporter substrate-binding protein [Mycobacterium sp. MYCO198283]MCG5430757.1 hypothetical protein [Mycobacterium sp. MYCO198283]
MLIVGGCASPPPQPLRVGATADGGAQVLAAVYAAALRTTGAPAELRVADDPLAALDAAEVDVVPGFTGRLLRRFDPAATAVSDAQVYRTLVGALPEGVAAGDYTTAAEDKPALAVTEATVARWGGQDLNALVGHCRDVTVGALRDAAVPAAVGRCRLPAPREFDSETALFDALRAARVTAAWTSTADPDTPADAVVLPDRQPPRIRAENVVPLYRRNGLTEPEVVAINQVAGELDTEGLTQLRRDVAAGGDPAAVADGWLAEHPLGN